MSDNIERKQNNKNMLRASLTAGGFALSILTAFTFITIGASYASESKKAETEVDYEYKKDAEDFLEGLTYLANKQYQEKIGVSTVSNYVTGISGLNYYKQGIWFCASAQKHDLEPSLVTIRLDYETSSEDELIFAIKNNYMKSGYFSMISELDKEETNEDAADLTFAHSLHFVRNYDTEKPYKRTTYEAKTKMAVSFTVQTTDGGYASAAEHRPFNQEYSGIYRASLETNKRMYYTLENIANSK